MSLEQRQKGPLGLGGSPKQSNIPDREENRTVRETTAASTDEHGSRVG